MTPKEKAIELVGKYYVTIYHTINQQQKAKECALIAVDKTILSRKDDSQFDDTLWAGGSDMYTMHPMYLNYWLDVKKEINNL